MTGKWIKFDFRGTLRIKKGSGISCVVSTFQNAKKLRCCLAAFALQDPNVQVTVADNSPDQHGVRWNYAVAKSYDMTYVNTSHIEGHAYGAANAICGVGEQLLDRDNKPWKDLVLGEWVCFPSDDGYHVPLFSKIVLETAAAHPKWDFIYWDTLYDPRRTGKYEVMNVQPTECRIDKTSFMVRTSVFREIGGFPPHANDWRDSALAQKLVNAGVPHGKAEGVLCVHS
jgi:GT2 family glycosyltransferase